MTGSAGPSTGMFTPAPGAAPLPRMVATHALMEARLLLRNGEQLVLALAIPVLTLVAGVVVAERLELSGDSPVDTLTPGVLTLAVLATSFTSLAIATGFERRYGVLKWLGSSPLPRSGLLLAKASALLLVELVQIAVLVAVAVGLGWRPELGVTAVAGGLLAVLLGTLAFAALGLLMAGTLRAEATLAAANLVFVVLAVAGGVVVGPAEYGDAGRFLALLPSGALHEAFAAALRHGALVWDAHAVLLAWAVAGTICVSRTFRWE